MICISQISLINPKDGERIAVPCGKCGACRQNRRSDWTFRIKQETKSAISAFFITLSYSDENVPLNDVIPTLSKPDLQKFIKRVRKTQPKTEGKHSIRYYAVGEYGTTTQRPHYHIILFNASIQTMDKLEQLWPLGHIHVGLVTDASIHYTTKYHVNFDKSKSEQINREPEFAVMSTKPAIGHNYLIKNRALHKDNTQYHVTNNGVKQRLPRYFRDKIFSETEKKGHSLNMQRKLEQERLREIDRLSALKVIDPLKYIQDREIRLSQGVKSKINEKSKNTI